MMGKNPDLRRVAGPNLVLRLIRPNDADYVYGLRTNPAYNTHLSAVTGTADDQRRWIDHYLAREAAGREYYYIIERRDGLPCGTVRIYDFGPDAFRWGSWILDANKPPKAALESAMLSFGIGFGPLDKAVAMVNVRIGNTHAIRFYQRLGMVEIGRDAEEVSMTYARTRFESDRDALLELLAEPRK